MSTKEVKLPSWFNGVLYESGDEVRNPYSGETYELNNVELSMYDFVMGASITLESGVPVVEDRDKLILDLQKGLDWFKQHNAKAYMVLLD